MVTRVPGEELTSVEHALVDHVNRGEWLDLTAHGEVIDEAAMRSWDESRIVGAAVIRDILRGRLAPKPDPHGLRLRGARITDRLDLENLSTEVDLGLDECFLEAGVLARDAHLATVGLSGCQLRHPTESPLDADRLTCSALALGGTTIVAHESAAAVRLVDAHISGPLDCTGAQLRNHSGAALIADGLQVDQGVFLSGGFTGAGEVGTVSLVGAHIDGQLNCTEAQLRNDSGAALDADGLQAGWGVVLNGGFTATGAGEAGAVRLAGAHIGGPLDCTGAQIHNDSGAALNANSLQADHVFLSGGFTATGAGEAGAVRLAGAHIGGQLNCTEAQIHNDSGVALIADGLQAGWGVLLSGRFTGAVRLAGAHISGQLNCTEAQIHNDSGVALIADGLQADQGVLLSGRFTATGAGEIGAVRVARAHISGELDCTGAQLRNDSGAALIADGLQVDHVFLRGGFTATGAGEVGAVRLAGAHISGQFDCTGAQLGNDSGAALMADGLQVDHDMFLRGGFTATGGGADAAVSLRGVRVGGTLAFAPAELAHPDDSHRRIEVDGLTYADVPRGISCQGWLDLLRDGTPSYAAQPYQQLAAGYRALGDERQVREILMAQRKDQLARADTRWPERLWGRVTKVTLGYGYQPWRALLFLAAVVALSCVLAWALGAHGALAQTNKTATPGQPCTVIQQISVGLDLNLPVGTSVARQGCDLTKDSASATAAWLTVTGWMLRVLAWVFAALFIAGFTSAVRKT